VEFCIVYWLLNNIMMNGGRKTGNFEQVFGQHFFERHAAPWCQDVTCKQLFHESLQLGDYQELYGNLSNK